MMPLPPRYLLPVPLPTPFRPGDPRHLDPLGLHVRDTTDPHKVRDRLVDIGVLRKNEDGTYSPYLPMKADLVNGKVPASQLPEGQQGVTDVLVDNVSVVTDGTARIDLSGKVDKEQGKGLSSNDYTTEEKTKLSGIETGAQKNVAPVAPSTDASAAGKPADAKATGDQLAARPTRMQIDAGWWSDWTVLRNGADVTAECPQPEYRGIPPTWACPVLTSVGWQFVATLLDDVDETSLAWSYGSDNYTAVRHRVAAPVPTKPPDIGAYQKPATGIPATDLAAAVQTSLGKADTALQGVTQNGSAITPSSGVADIDAPLSEAIAQPYSDQATYSAGQMCIYQGRVYCAADDITLPESWNPAHWAENDIVAVIAVLAEELQLKANAADLRYAAGETITASAQLADRTGNRVVPLSDNTADIVLTFPGAVTNYLRDFEILVTNTVGNTGNITFTPPTGATVYGDGFLHSPASGETWLYVVSEASANVFWCKSEKMEVAQ